MVCEYTVSQKKLCHFYFYCNFGKCWSIFIILSMSESEINGLWQEWKISHHSLTLLLHYLVKLILVWMFAWNWRFCVEKHQTSFLQICGLQTVQISIQLITRCGLSCISVVYIRRKSTPSTNWSRDWMKFDAALNSRLSAWLLISGAKDLELVFVRREDTSNIVFELNDCLDFVKFLSPSLSCFAWILHHWVKQHCCNGLHSH